MRVKIMNFLLTIFDNFRQNEYVLFHVNFDSSYIFRKKKDFVTSRFAIKSKN